MNSFTQPKLPIPPILIVSEENSFAYYTFTNRLPTIIESIISENNFSPHIVKELRTIKKEILNGIIRFIKNDGGLDVAQWNNYIQPFLDKKWIDTPFYFAEAYFYRRIIEAINYFKSDLKEKIDPFQLQKQLGLEKAMDSIRKASLEFNDLEAVYPQRDDKWKEVLYNLLYLNLWGNRADLSLRPTEAGQYKHENYQPTEIENHIILDDRHLVVKLISKFKKKRIDFIIDNAGFELVSDLFLIDFLLESGAAQEIYLHCKNYPTFVSDATIKDVIFTLNFLAKDDNSGVSKLGLRLKTYLENGKIYLLDDIFWTSPLFFWEMPAKLQEKLSHSDLIFIKGDANYRRLVGDCHWEKTASFQNITCYFPSSFTVLRALKCEVIVGLEENQINLLQSIDSQWQTNGQWGLIQLFTDSH